MTNIVQADDSNFSKTLADAGDRTVLVDYYAPWCGPCKAMAPALETFAQNNPDVLVVKVNVDDAPDTAMAAGIRSVPTLEARRGGNTPARRTGAQNVSQLEALIKQAA
jgi:thioredoxin